VFGPYVGGYLGSKGDYFVGAKVASILSIAAAALVYTLPAEIDTSVTARSQPALRPEGAVESTDGNKQQQQQQPDALAPWSSRAYLVLRLAGVLLLTKVVSSVANSMASSAQPLILKNQLGFTEQDLGLFMSAQFAFGGFSNGVLLGPITAFLGGKLSSVVRNCVAVMALAYAVQAAVYSEPSLSALAMLAPGGELSASQRNAPFVCTTMLLSLFQFSLGTTITAETTAVVPSHMKGTLLGIEHSQFAVARIFGPATGVAILGWGGISALSAACSSVFMLVLAFLLATQGSTCSKVGGKVD
jgi:hypothetical protein